MPKFSANLTYMFNEVDFLGRFERAASAGFKAVEFGFPYEWPKEQIVEQLGKHSLQQVLFNLPAGDWQAGERGIACSPDRVGEFQQGVGLAIDYAKALKCPRVNCIAGITPEDVTAEKVRQTLVDNLRFAAEAMQKEGIRLLIEPLNDQTYARFYLVRTRDALKLMTRSTRPTFGFNMTSITCRSWKVT